MDFNNIDFELMKEAPTLHAISRKNPFTVPENYFDSLTKTLNTRIQIENVRFENEQEFKLPENYFEQLPDLIEARIALESINSSVIADTGFSTPPGYFDELSPKILALVDAQPRKTQTVRKLKPMWLSYAAAASVALIAGITLFFNLRNNNIDTQLSQIPEQDIINYLQMHADVGDTPAIMETLNHNASYTQLSNDVSADDLEFYINNTL